jgi:NAD(P)-dependent dehydrogenase (short-subunit alcohol dehydrogenase family)
LCWRQVKEFRGRVAVVTGGASGIGYALAERFAREGMKIVLADVQADALEEAEGRLRSDGAEVLAVETDVSRAASVDHLRDRVLDKFGAAHVVCNNAGVSTQGSVWETTLGDWQWIMGVNLWGVINGVRAFVPVLLEQEEAHVVNTASMAGIITGILGPYSVTKQAVVGLSEALYFGLRKQGAAQVGVSVLCPGWVNTRIVDSERNRPPELEPPGPVSEADQATADAIRRLLASAMDPSEVAQKVFDAILAEQFYIVTHPEMKGSVKWHYDDIMSGGPPRATFG